MRREVNKRILFAFSTFGQVCGTNTLSYFFGCESPSMSSRPSWKPTDTRSGTIVTNTSDMSCSQKNSDCYLVCYSLKTTYIFTFSPVAKSAQKTSDHISIPVVSLSEPPFHEKPSSGASSEPIHSEVFCLRIY